MQLWKNQKPAPEGKNYNLTQLEPAQDAHIRVAGFDIESDTNVFEDAIDGVTITATKQTEPGEEIALDVAFDSASVTSRIQNFVAEYNKMQVQLAKMRSYNA